MASEIVRQESWINEVLRINSHIGRINEVEFVYSLLSSIEFEAIVAAPSRDENHE
jgi:hypothetical protein